MIPPYTLNGHTIAARVDPSTGVEVISCQRRWLCWPLFVVLAKLSDQPHLLPLEAVQHEWKSREHVNKQLFRDSIHTAIVAADLSRRTKRAGTIGLAWWARPLAEAGTRNRAAILEGGHPVVKVVRKGEVVGLIAASVAREQDGRTYHPSHDIHGRPWGTGADPMGLRIKTPFDGGAA